MAETSGFELRRVRTNAIRLVAADMHPTEVNRLRNQIRRLALAEADMKLVAAGATALSQERYVPHLASAMADRFKKERIKREQALREAGVPAVPE